MSKYCPKCHQIFPNDWEECNECEIALVYEDRPKELILSDEEKRKYDSLGRIYMSEGYIEEQRQQQQNVPKCPTCGSTHVHKISGLDRAASVMLFGIFSKKINKSFKCDNCGYTW